MSFTAFDKALTFALRWEGGYSNHPADKGGETNKGITHATYNSYRRAKRLPIRSVKFLEQSELHEIYCRNYWEAAGCDLLPEKLAIAHFDWAVNAGVGRAVKTLQLVVGAAADGIIGSKTKAAIATALAQRGEAAVCHSYCEVREACYRRWGVGSQVVFLAGWLNRLRSLRSEIA